MTWPKTATILPENLSAIVRFICEFFWTTCISGKRVGQKRPLFCPKTSLRLYALSVNFFERHVFLIRVLAKNGHFFARKPFDFFKHDVFRGIFVCIFSYLALLRSRGRPSACHARSAARIMKYLFYFFSGCCPKMASSIESSKRKMGCGKGHVSKSNFCNALET